MSGGGSTRLSILDIYLRRYRIHRDAFGTRANLKGDVQTQVAGDNQALLGKRGLGEARSFDGDGIAFPAVIPRSCPAGTVGGCFFYLDPVPVLVAVTELLPPKRRWGRSRFG